MANWLGAALLPRLHGSGQRITAPGGLAGSTINDEDSHPPLERNGGTPHVEGFPRGGRGGHRSRLVDLLAAPPSPGECEERQAEERGRRRLGDHHGDEAGQEDPLVERIVVDPQP